MTYPFRRWQVKFEVNIMETYITIKEAAELKGCSARYMRQIVQAGKILGTKTEYTSTNRPRYLIPLSALGERIRKRYYDKQGGKYPNVPQQSEPVRRRNMDEFTARQRDVIGAWLKIFNEWKEFVRTRPSKTEATKEFVRIARHEYPQLKLTVDILYRKYRESRHGEILEALIDKRGEAKKGTSNIPQDIKNWFEYLYLSKDIPVKKVYEALNLAVEAYQPELLDVIPSLDTCYRWANQIPYAVSVLARKGSKAYDDKCAPSIERIYDDLYSNDIWCADGHRIDVISVDDHGKQHKHRLTLSAILDIRSGVYVGWVVTDNPSSHATLCALRNAIIRTQTVPRMFYVDNGREYLTYDIGGMGHRARKVKVDIKLPTPILERLGIQMINALPANGAAKPIERSFRDFTFLPSLMDGYCGSNVTAKPESLKHNIKLGKLPTDSEVIKYINDMIEGYFNIQPYNGKVVRDRGKTKMEVFGEYCRHARHIKDESTLNLMLMRSTRAQKVGKSGVYVMVGGEKIYYLNDELWSIQGQQVFVRYDPDDMQEVRVYDINDKYIMTVPINLTMLQSFLACATDQEGLREAMAEKRRYKKLAKEQIDIISRKIEEKHEKISMLNLFAVAAELNKDYSMPTVADVTEIIYGEEYDDIPAAVGNDTYPTAKIDKLRMIENAKKRKDDLL